MYLQEVSEALRKKIEYDQWSTQPAAADASPDAPATAARSAFKDMSDFVDVEGKAKELGFVVGSFVYEKSFENIRVNWWSIIEIQSIDCVILQKVFSYKPESELPRIRLSLERLSAWGIKKDPEVPKIIATGQNRPESINTDKMKCNAWMELIKADKAYTKADQGIEVWSHPLTVRSRMAIPEGQLVLVPLVPLAHIVIKSNRGYQEIHEDPSLYLSCLYHSRR